MLDGGVEEKLLKGSLRSRVSTRRELVTNRRPEFPNGIEAVTNENRGNVG